MYLVSNQIHPLDWKDGNSLTREATGVFKSPVPRIFEAPKPSGLEILSLHLPQPRLFFLGVDQLPDSIYEKIHILTNSIKQITLTYLES